MGYTISFSGQDDYDNFLLRTDKDLQFNYLRIIISESKSEYFYTMALESNIERYLVMAGNIDVASTTNTVGLVVAIDLSNWSYTKNELGSSTTNRDT